MWDGDVWLCKKDASDDKVNMSTFSRIEEADVLKIYYNYDAAPSHQYCLNCDCADTSGSTELYGLRR